MNRQQGLALVLVLWMLTLMTIMAASFTLTMRREAAIIGGLKNDAEARAVAEAGVALAELMLLNTDPETQWLTDGRIYEVNYDGVPIRLRLLSESGKVDINVTDETQLSDLMRYVEEDEEKQQRLVGAILDWRDQDDEVGNNGAEQDDYRAAGLKYVPPNRPFKSLAELQMVLGMDSYLFNRLEPLVTVYSNKAIDLTKASKEVLEALNLDPANPDAETPVRDLVPQQPAPVDNPFAAAALRAQQQAGGGEVVTIISEARVDADKKAMLKVVVKQASNGRQPFEIMDWQNDAVSHGSLFSADMDVLLSTEYAESRYDH